MMITAEEVGELISMKAQTIKNWAKREEIPAYQFGISWRFDKEEIEQSLYANFSCPIEGFGRVEIGCS